MQSAGMKSLCLKFPKTIRTNDYWHKKYPDIVKNAEKRTLAKLWQYEQEEPEGAFDIEMMPFIKDPFRGTVERRCCTNGETGLSLELAAGREAIEKAGLRPGDIDLVISSALRPTNVALGNATFLARDLELTGHAFNLETACTGTTASFQTAVALIKSGMYRNILVTISCTYTLDAEESDTLSWFLGDGAGAFVVSQVPEGEGYLGGKFVHSGDTCEAFSYPVVNDEQTGEAKVRFVAGRGTGKVLRGTSASYLETCCYGALEAANLKKDDVNFFVFNTPTAWFSAFAARQLEIRPDQTVSTNRIYANIGPALTPANLHYAARTGGINPGDLVLIYSVGSISSAGAVVVRWGDVKLGADPPMVYDR